MIRIVLFELDGTLVDDRGRPFPHARLALDAIAQLRTPAGNPVMIGLVGGGPHWPNLPTPAKVKPAFDALVARLQAAGLRPPFEPVARHVTLPAHTGTSGPGRALYEQAIAGLQTNATLGDCVLVSSDAAQVSAARGPLGMQALRFGPVRGTTHEVDFDDWSQAPALVAHRIDPADVANLQVAAAAWLASRGVDLEAIETGTVPDRWPFSGQRWHPLRVPGHDELGTLHVALPLQGTLQRDRAGSLSAILAEPGPDEIAEAGAFVASLAAHRQIAQGELAAGATHSIETDADGQRRLVRKRLSAW